MNTKFGLNYLNTEYEYEQWIITRFLYLIEVF